MWSRSYEFITLNCCLTFSFSSVYSVIQVFFTVLLGQVVCIFIFVHRRQNWCMMSAMYCICFMPAVDLPPVLYSSDRIESSIHVYPHTVSPSPPTHRLVDPITPSLNSPLSKVMECDIWNDEKVWTLMCWLIVFANYRLS